jgi:hypothetical protein
VQGCGSSPSCDGRDVVLLERRWWRVLDRTINGVDPNPLSGNEALSYDGAGRHMKSAAGTTTVTCTRDVADRTVTRTVGATLTARYGFGERSEERGGRLPRGCSKRERGVPAVNFGVDVARARIGEQRVQRAMRAASAGRVSKNLGIELVERTSWSAVGRPSTYCRQCWGVADDAMIKEVAGKGAALFGGAINGL